MKIIPEETPYRITQLQVKGGVSKKHVGRYTKSMFLVGLVTLLVLASVTVGILLLKQSNGIARIPPDQRTSGGGYEIENPTSSMPVKFEECTKLESNNTRLAGSYKCTATFFGSQEKLFNACVAKRGRILHVDPIVNKDDMWCELDYYNYAFEFPTNYEDCILTEKGTQLDNVVPNKPSCIVNIQRSVAYDEKRTISMITPTQSDRGIYNNCNWSLCSCT
jgi:hypothetical protein